MWKLIAVIAVLALAVTAGSTVANAQGVINLHGSASTLTFTGDGSGSPSTISFTLGAECPSGSCTAVQNGGPSGFYDITGSPSITLTNVNTFEWTVAQSAPLTFSFCSTVDCGGAGNVTYLTGTLELVDLLQGGNIGSYNYTGNANLTVTGGTLAFTPQGIANINLQFKSLTDLSLLLDTTGSVPGVSISGGTIDPTPEPSTMLLFGSGLLLAGAIIRRRLA
jgi:PEP-CTERM motif